MSLFISLLGGAAAKLYDDLEDNMFLQKFRNTTFMEFLKGIHYISCTSLSIEEPMFFIILYATSFFHSFTNKEGYSNPYEHSLLYSFLLLFIILDYKKITSFSLTDTLNIVLLISLISIEPLIMKILCNDCKDSEYSFIKMILRCIGCCNSIILYYFNKSQSIKFFISYVIGYLLISILVQFYSVRME